MPTDTELLDWLQAKLNEKRYTGKCFFRWSDYGSGMRLQETMDIEANANVRTAIEDAMNREVK